jgi:hypothetical protein
LGNFSFLGGNDAGVEGEAVEGGLLVELGVLFICGECVVQGVGLTDWEWASLVEVESEVVWV